MLNDEFPLNIADKTVIENEETPDKTRIGDDTEGIEICISQTDGMGSTQTFILTRIHSSRMCTTRCSDGRGGGWALSRGVSVSEGGLCLGRGRLSERHTPTFPMCTE